MKSQQSESTNIDHDFKNKRVNGPIACCKLKINRFGFDRTKKKNCYQPSLSMEGEKNQ